MEQVSGLAVHAYLWAVFALALLEFVVLAARYAPGRHAFTLPGYRWILAITSGLICFAVLVAFVTKPIPWYGRIEMGGALYVVVGCRGVPFTGLPFCNRVGPPLPVC